MDFSRYRQSGIFYGGTEKKLGILFYGTPYMLKFQKRTDFGLINNHVCEYIGSHIFSLLGFTTQETYLGTYKGENVVACRDFNASPGVQFVPFNDVGESSLDQDKETYQYSYDDIMQMLRVNSKLVSPSEMIHLFWEIYIVDALIGNFDRHGGNWGFLKENNAYSPAPVFDNGSCLYPRLTDEDEMKAIIASEEETNRRIFTFPTSQIQLHGKKSSYYDVISSLSFPECNEALRAVCERLDMNEVDKLIDNTPYTTQTQREFYKYMLHQRWEKILHHSLLKLEGR